MNVIKKNFVPRFLEGNGEMAALTRRFDWSKTSVGSIEDWPSSLSTVVSILLKSKFPMFLWWGDDLIQFYNDAYRPSLGNNGKHPSALGQKGEDCWTEIWPIIKPLIDTVRSTGEATWSENQLIPIYRNGKLEDVYWTFSYSPVYDEDENIKGVLVVCNETTNEVNAIKRISQSEEHFQNLVRQATVGIVVLIGETMLVQIANEMYGRLINSTPDQLIGKPLFDIVPDAKEPFLPLLLKVLHTGEPVYLYDHVYLVYINGEEKSGYINVVYQPYRDINGKIIGVMALCHDVTEQVRARKKLEEIEEKARLAIAISDLGTYEINLETDEIITSERLNAIWGTERSLQRKEFVNLIHPDDIAMRQKAHEESLRSGTLHYEARVIWKDQSVHWLKVRGKVMYDEKGKPKNLLGVVQDITEQKLFAQQLSAQVTERTLELQRSNDDLLQFAHVTSHDLKEPVRKVKLYSNRLETELEEILPAYAKNYLHKIQMATDRMYAMIDGVLKYSALNSSEVVIETINLNTLIKTIEADLEVLIHQKNAIITTAELPVIQGAFILIYQLFYNLINNALKFTRPGTGAVISIDAYTVKHNNADYVNIEVRDNGIGFEEKHAQNIFDTFTRLNSKDKFEGTGLGLALCKKIAERHSGSISATGKEGSGALFKVSLPIKQNKQFI